MAFSTRAKELINNLLRPVNVRLDSLTAEATEQTRVARLEAAGHFERQVYPLPASFRSEVYRDVLADLPKYAQRFATFSDALSNDVAFAYDNGFFTSPDAEVLYTLIRKTRPSRIVEIGCGNSTKVIRQAILDGKFECRHTCIDPEPRRDISQSADRVMRLPIESCDAGEIAGELKAGDILFIDTSHELAPANDVAYIYTRLLPLIETGVLIHIHDIFLPYEYPLEWIRDLRLNWSEEYLVQIMLTGDDRWEVLWPGYYLQRTLPNFSSHFPHEGGRRAQSLWITRKSART